MSDYITKKINNIIDRKIIDKINSPKFTDVDYIYIHKKVSLSEFVNIIQNEVINKQSNIEDIDSVEYMVWERWGFDKICAYVNITNK